MISAKYNNDNECIESGFIQCIDDSNNYYNFIDFTQKQLDGEFIPFINERYWTYKSDRVYQLFAKPIIPKINSESSEYFLSAYVGQSINWTGFQNIAIVTGNTELNSGYVNVDWFKLNYNLINESELPSGIELTSGGIVSGVFNESCSGNVEIEIEPVLLPTPAVTKTANSFSKLQENFR